jgi:hypothetical protein
MVLNLRADTQYKQTLGYFEAWKVLFAAIAATALLVGIGAGWLGYEIGKIPPAPIIILLQQAK